jgi:succinyl-CoA synthetase beta subunit
VDLHEYQGKELFRRYGIPVSEGRVASTPHEARSAAHELGGRVVIKAQVLTGGRGKAGGVRLAEGLDDAERVAAEMLGLDIRGHIVRTLWVEEASEIAKEYYLSVTFDRGARKPLLMLTTEGGVEIEDVAAGNPGALARLHVDPLVGYQPFEGRRLVFGAGIGDPGEQQQVMAIVEKLYRCFVGEDAMLCEINPLIVTPSGEIRALDAKFTVDDSALFRHPEVAAWRDASAADPLEAFARELGVTYVKLDGTVAIIGNGAGLAMSSVDLIVVAGGAPANFCDLGGASNADTVTHALEVVARDPQVRSILFNIFAGITRCDEIARGMLVALESTAIAAPIVVRFDGTNADEGRRILAESGRANIFFEPTMLDAARRAVELAR